jgi:flagellin-like protein
MWNFKLNKFSKKGLSDVITTVLIILITISAIVIIGSTIISFSRNSLYESTRCSDVQNEITIVSEWSCYDNSAQNTSVQIRFGNVNVSKIYISLDINGNTNTYDEIDLPTINGGKKTYTFNNTISTFVKVGAYVKDKKCDASDSSEIGRCKI